MNAIKAFFQYSHDALHIFDFGFWPSLVLSIITLVGANGLYYLYTSRENPTEDISDRKRSHKRFWWLLVAQIVFLAQGLLAIYINNAMVSGGMYRLLILYYLVAAFCILIFGAGLWGRLLKRKAKQH